MGERQQDKMPNRRCTVITGFSSDSNDSGFVKVTLPGKPSSNHRSPIQSPRPSRVEEDPTEPTSDYPSTIHCYDSTGPFRDKKLPKQECGRRNRVLAIGFGALLIFASIITVVFLVIGGTNDPPKTIVYAPLGNDRLIDVKIPHEIINQTHNVVLNPPVLDNNGRQISLTFNNHGVARRSVSNVTTTWQMDYEPLTELFVLRGPPAKCSSNGTYYIQLLNKDNVTIHTFNFTVIVLSETTKTNLTLEQNTDSGNNLTCIQSFGCSQRNQQITLKVKDSEVFSLAQESCISFKDDEGFTGRVSTVVPHELARVSSEFTCKSTAVVDADEDGDDNKAKESVLTLGDDCDLITCSVNCTRKYGPDYRFAHQSRCDKYWRCAFGVLHAQTSAANTFFDARLDVCADSHTVDVPWCNDDGTLQQHEDVSEHVCGYNNDN